MIYVTDEGIMSFIEDCILALLSAVRIDLVCSRVFACDCTHTHVYTCIYVCVCACMRACEQACVRTRMCCACMYVFI